MKNKFYIGGKVKCINANKIIHSHPIVSPPLKNNAMYPVLGLSLCECGQLKIDIGLKSIINTTECTCGKTENCSTWWCASERFVPVEDIEETQKQEKEYVIVEIDKRIKETRKEVVFEN